MRSLLKSVSVLALSACLPLLVAGPSYSQSTSQTTGASVEQRLQSLEGQREQTDEELKQKDVRIKELDARIKELEKQLQGASVAPPAAMATGAGTSPATVPAPVSEVAKEAAAIQAEEATEVDTSTPMAPGKGFQVANGEYGSMNIGLYALVRATEQLPATQEATDHLNRTFAVDTRQDIQLHRVMVHFRGWAYDPKFNYQLTVWTVNDTEQVKLIGALGYRFSEKFSLWGGMGPNPGTRSMLGSHPFWQGHDRVMADEYFRPGFTFGVWGTGEIAPGLNYQLTLGNQVSALGVNSVEDTRDLSYGGSVWWMPTTKEFGPQGAFGDFEMHDELATRFGVSSVWSPSEDRASQPSQSSPDTTQIRLGDSLLLFGTGSLGDNVTIQKANFKLLSVDAGMKYEGIFLQTELYYRLLDDFRLATGSLGSPVQSIRDKGFYVQSGFFPIPRKLETYASTSWVFPDSGAGYDQSHDFILGANWYWSGTRYQRMNFQWINVTRSPASSTFGYYTGGMNGNTYTVDVSMLF